ncbi:MAG TPA: M43 family zinc metalloprotease, partial [Cytophagaceae bacterium]|nr:M43 family zinc metalloprotease [Cytophagaceae bacterium]
SNTPAMFKSIAADVQIEFCLAVRDPNGDPTTGINRIYNSQASYNVDLTAGSVDDTTIKNKSYWPSDQYLNIWVCDLAGGILGYAEFPGTMPVTSDGVVIDYTAFGNTNSSRYNLGRTATHEIGHWLNLYHIWGDQSDCSGDDFCADTNPCSGTYYSDHTQGCPMPLQCGFPRMIQNYLDYSDDACMNLFTNDQKSRMQGAMTTSSRRIAIQNSLGCCNTCYVPHANFTTTQQYNVLLGQAITLTDHSTGNINTYTWSFDSGAVPSSSATGAGPQTIYYSTSGDKTVTLTTTGTYGTDSKTIIIHVVTTAPYADFFASKTTGVHVNETLSFFNSSTGSIDSYSWDFGTDAVPSTATGIGPHSVYYTSQGLKTASLTVSSATLGSDTKTKDYYISVVPTTDTTSLYIYPNPAKEVVALSTTFKSPTKVHILIFDRLGKKIFDQENAEMTSYNDIIDVKGWADGLYIIKFIAGDSNVSTWKLLVIK